MSSFLEMDESQDRSPFARGYKTPVLRISQEAHCAFSEPELERAQTPSPPRRPQKAVARTRHRNSRIFHLFGEAPALPPKAAERSASTLGNYAVDAPCEPERARSALPSRRSSWKMNTKTSPLSDADVEDGDSDSDQSSMDVPCHLLTRESAKLKFDTNVYGERTGASVNSSISISNSASASIEGALEEGAARLGICGNRLEVLELDPVDESVNGNSTSGSATDSDCVNAWPRESPKPISRLPKWLPALGRGKETLKTPHHYHTAKELIPNDGREQHWDGSAEGQQGAVKGLMLHFPEDESNSSSQAPASVSPNRSAQRDDSRKSLDFIRRRPHTKRSGTSLTAFTPEETDAEERNALPPRPSTPWWKMGDSTSPSQRERERERDRESSSPSESTPSPAREPSLRFDFLNEPPPTPVKFSAFKSIPHPKSKKRGRTASFKGDELRRRNISGPLPLTPSPREAQGQFGDTGRADDDEQGSTKTTAVAVQRFRSWRDRISAEELKKMPLLERKRQETIAELVESERAHARDMQTIVEVSRLEPSALDRPASPCKH